MKSIASELRAQGSIDGVQLDAAVALQSLHGGHLLTSLFEVGFDEDELQDLLSVLVGFPVGPRGCLQEPEASLWSMLSPAIARRYRVFPIAYGEDGLSVATATSIAPSAERSMADSLKVAMRAVVVTPLRLREALYRFCGGPFSDRERWLLALQASGRPLRFGERDAQLRRHASNSQERGPSYRRMSERPGGIVRSGRQPEPHLPDLEELMAMLRAPVVPSESSTEPQPETRPYDLRSSVYSTVSSTPPPVSEEPSRITQPYAEGEEPPEGEDEAGDDGDKRDTQPWRDDEDEAPVSVTGEFSASLTHPPDPSDRPDGERHFRHRGPFTRRQAEMAAAQATDVHLLLEILMRYAQQFFERCLLLGVVENRLEVRYRHGVTSEEPFSLPLDGAGIGAEAHRSGDPVMRPLGQEQGDQALREFLELEGGAQVVMVPITIRERVVAMFYGDDGLEDVHHDAVHDVTDFTEVCASEVLRLIVARKRSDG